MNIETVVGVSAGLMTVIDGVRKIMSDVITDKATEECRALIAKLTDELVKARIEALKVHESVLELKKSMDERKNYALANLEGTGAFVYKYVGDDRSVPAHYICQTCFDVHSVKSVIQNSRRFGMYCPSCYSRDRK